MEQGTTILLTTQYLDEADKLADRIAVIDQGTVIAEGTATDLKSRVGEERLELVIAPASNFGAAVKVIQDKAVQTNIAERTISVPVAGQGSVTEVKRILNLMEHAKIEIDSLSLHQPTLDDVFLQLTGHEAANDNTPL